MKKLLVAGLLLLATIAGAQTPEAASAFLIGPTYDGEGVSIRLGGARQIAGRTWIAGFAQLGSTVEAGGEVIILLKTSIKGLTVGPIGGVVGDWSTEPGVGGDPLGTYLIGLTGVASTYSISENMGSWAYLKYATSFEESAYDDGWTGGFGLWFLL